MRVIAKFGIVKTYLHAYIITNECLDLVFPICMKKVHPIDYILIVDRCEIFTHIGVE